MSDYISTNAQANPIQAIVRDIYLSARQRGKLITWQQAEQLATENQDKRSALKAESERRGQALFGPDAPQPPDPEQVRAYYRWQRENGV